MNLTDYRAYCLSMPGTTEDFPFDQEVLVFKVGGKIFALTDVNTFEFVNLKCDRERAIDLRERHAGITPGYHMSKKHWNSIALYSDVPDAMLLSLSDESYTLVLSSLPRKVREGII